MLGIRRLLFFVFGRKNRNFTWNEKNNDSPPDLDKLLAQLRKNLFFGYKKSSNGGGASGGFSLSAVIIFVVIAIIFYGILGFFKVEAGEQAVILFFGKYQRTVGPGPHWTPPLISSREIVNVKRLYQARFDGEMITKPIELNVNKFSSKNNLQPATDSVSQSKEVSIVNLSLVVRYRISNIYNYLFEVYNPLESLAEATRSSMRQIVADSTLEEVLTTNFSYDSHEKLDIKTQKINTNTLGKKIAKLLRDIISPYKTGLFIESVEILSVQPPDEVRDAFNDAIKSQEDGKTYLNQASAYSEKVLQKVKGQIAKISQEAKAYYQRKVNLAAGNISAFKAILPKYQLSPQVTHDRLYIETLENIFAENGMPSIFIAQSNTKGGSSNNLLYLPLDKLLANNNLIDVQKIMAEHKSISVNNDANADKDTRAATLHAIGTNQNSVIRNWRRSGRGVREGGANE